MCNDGSKFTCFMPWPPQITFHSGSETIHDAAIECVRHAWDAETESGRLRMVDDRIRVDVKSISSGDVTRVFVDADVEFRVHHYAEVGR